MMYDLATQTWGEVDNNDAVYHVHDRTHYADLMDSVGKPLLLAQIRCTVQSIMNTERPSVSGVPVAMPEMQFFGLPTKTTNAGNVATVSYLKAEDANGKLHDMLGTQATLPYQNFGSGTTYFKFYVGGGAYIASNLLYLSIHTAGGTITTPAGQNIGNSPVTFSVSGDYRTTPAYYELYVTDTSGDTIILSSGYTGEPS